MTGVWRQVDPAATVLGSVRTGQPGRAKRCLSAATTPADHRGRAYPSVNLHQPPSFPPLPYNTHLNVRCDVVLATEVQHLLCHCKVANDTACKRQVPAQEHDARGGTRTHKGTKKVLHVCQREACGITAGHGCKVLKPNVFLHRPTRCAKSCSRFLLARRAQRPQHALTQSQCSHGGSVHNLLEHDGEVVDCGLGRWQPHHHNLAAGSQQRQQSIDIVFC